MFSLTCLKPSLKPSFRSTAMLKIAADSFLDIQFVEDTQL